MKSIHQVDSIIQEELQEYVKWLENAPGRKLLAEYKTEVVEWVHSYLLQQGQYIEDDAADMAINRIMRKSFKQQGKKVPQQEMEMIVEEHI